MHQADLPEPSDRPERAAGSSGVVFGLIHPSHRPTDPRGGLESINAAPVAAHSRFPRYVQLSRISDLLKRDISIYKRPGSGRPL